MLSMRRALFHLSIDQSRIPRRRHKRQRARTAERSLASAELVLVWPPIGRSLFLPEDRPQPIMLTLKVQVVPCLIEQMASKYSKLKVMGDQQNYVATLRRLGIIGVK